MCICGTTAVPCETLQHAASFIVRPPPDFPTEEFPLLPLMGAERVTSIAPANLHTENLLRLLKQVQNAKSEDPRDRLFALLGICTEESDVDIDYAKPVEAVYRDWALRRIHRTRTFDVFAACADSGSRDFLLRFQICATLGVVTCHCSSTLDWATFRPRSFHGLTIMIPAGT